MDSSNYKQMVELLLPPGAAWNPEQGSTLGNFILSLADEMARFDARALDLLTETDTRTTSELIDEWERVLGLPEICISGEQSLAERRVAATAKLIAQGGQSRQYYIDVAAALGFAITITEFQEKYFQVETSNVEEPLAEGWIYHWRINAPDETIYDFSVDEDGVETGLRYWGNELLECVMNRIKPAHTQLLFAYGS